MVGLSPKGEARLTERPEAGSRPSSLHHALTGPLASYASGSRRKNSSRECGGLDLPVELRTSGPLLRAPRHNRMKRSGEGRNRTGDTTVFSRVLYQLSYLARAAAV